MAAVLRLEELARLLPVVTTGATIGMAAGQTAEAGEQMAAEVGVAALRSEALPDREGAAPRLDKHRPLEVATAAAALLDALVRLFDV